MSRRRPDESREPSQRPDPGFHREPWIPAFAGMTEIRLFRPLTRSSNTAPFRIKYIKEAIKRAAQNEQP